MLASKQPQTTQKQIDVIGFNKTVFCKTRIFTFIYQAGADWALVCSLLIPAVGHTHQQGLIKKSTCIRRYGLPGIAAGFCPFLFMLESSI